MNRAAIIFVFLSTLLPAAVAEPLLIDSIVAIVDEDIISKRELDSRVEQVRRDFNQSNRSLPDAEVLYRQVLEVMISDSILLQEARGRGIRTTDGQINQALQSVARDNNLSLTGFRQALIDNGYDYEQYREALRKELTINNLRRQFDARSSTVTEAEVDDFLRSSGNDSAESEYLLSHILIALPDAAAPAQVRAALETANTIIERLSGGEKFEQLANEYSSGSDALQGGSLGWRKTAEIPSLFSEPVLTLEPGEFAGPLRSASGYHIVSLDDRRSFEQVLTEQTRSRHILLRSNDLISEEEARSRLEDLRQQILDGNDFADLARLYSVDYSSGAEGGDIGWTDPGGTVPEYEAMTKVLPPGEVSIPFRSQYGWHIVEVTGRRTVDETEESKRRKIESQLLQQKQREAFDIWIRRLRDEAYVVFPNTTT